jgi:hypothetical protein
MAVTSVNTAKRLKRRSDIGMVKSSGWLVASRQ